jgi:hypothetical protein
VSAAKKALAGVAGGVGGTLVLSALRSALREVGLVYETAPMQVVERLVQKADLPADRPVAKGALSLAAHLAYGTAGAAFGALRGEAEDAGTEVAVGAALGVLLWGLGGRGGCPSLGRIVHRGTTTTPRCCYRSSITLCTERCGECCSGPSHARAVEIGPRELSASSFRRVDARPTLEARPELQGNP